MKKWQADLAIIGAATIWGISFIFTRWGLNDCSPALFLLTRFGLALIISLALFGRHLRGLSRPTFRRGVILGFLMGGGYLLQNYSVNFTEVSRAAFIAALTLPAIPVMSFILFREKIKVNNLLGIILAVFGLYLLLDPTFNGLKIGDIIAFVSVPLWALYLIYINIFTEGNDEPHLTVKLLVLQFVGAIPLVLLFTIVFESGLWPYLHPDLGKGLTATKYFWAGLFYCAILASICIVFIQTSCQKYTTPVQAMLCFQFEPITATAGAWLWLDEPVGFKAILGAGIIILGVLLSELGAIFLGSPKSPSPNPPN
ncbi:MAG: DMT family transporter [Deltaproteobacteria bacterium]|jgi:drug/metabolite transporter (DMT)-like permease|nr:DMT family transporter [Deltaproteobacteria bacterium]